MPASRGEKGRHTGEARETSHPFGTASRAPARTVDDETHLLEALAEVTGVEGELLDAGLPVVGAVAPHDDAHGGKDLLAHGRRHGRGKVLRVRRRANGVDNVRRRRNVAAGRAEALGERAHHNVHVVNVHAEELQKEAPPGAACVRTSGSRGG